MQRTSSSGHRTGKGQVILVVDDHPDVLELFTEMLSALGYSPVGVSTAEQALHCLATDDRDYALVLSDISMPGMSGIELYRKVRERHVDLPFILTTGMGDQAMNAIYQRHGIAVVLSKPFTIVELAQAVGQALSH